MIQCVSMKYYSKRDNNLKQLLHMEKLNSSPDLIFSTLTDYI